MEKEEVSWIACNECQGRGKKRHRPVKKARLQYQLAIDKYEKSIGDELPPVKPLGNFYPCQHCNGSGLIPSESYPFPDTENYPHVAIIGGGIGGVALAVACLHRRIPFTLYERDSHFDARSQGYGLTLQQASNAIKGFGLFDLKEGVYSSRHAVLTTDGKVIVEWGMRISRQTEDKSTPKRTNVHIARQSLRTALLEQLGGTESVQWGHQLTDFMVKKGGGIELSFQVNGEMKSARADLIVGADGIRSSVRRLLFGEDQNPLRYLGYMVILGICKLDKLKDVESHLLDSATVFQTVNGQDRIYMMPFSADSIMWQLSFPMEEKEAKALSALGASALKEEACRRTQWHTPIPQILAHTPANLISGYPVYDREVLKPDSLLKAGPVTLIGDAAHPMSPFKGQGANQALLDALALGRGIAAGCAPYSSWRETGIRNSVLTEFESEMLERSANKVKDSAEAAQLLHSDIALREGDSIRGRGLKKRDV